MYNGPVASEDATRYLRSLSSVPLWEQPLAERRQEMRRECSAGAGPLMEMVSVVNVDAFGVPARLYRPTGAERGLLVWMHGGAWMFGDLDCSDAVVRTMAGLANCSVLSVDYRLVPEHRFPAAIEDCWAALQWARQETDLLAVGGDSSGGNLAAATAILARDAATELRLQLLVYPVLDFRVDSVSYRDFQRTLRRLRGDRVLRSFEGRRNTLHMGRVCSGPTAAHRGTGFAAAGSLVDGRSSRVHPYR